VQVPFRDGVGVALRRRRNGQATAPAIGWLCQ